MHDIPFNRCLVLCVQRLLPDSTTSFPHALGVLGCGALATALAQTATYPLDTLRRRMQLSGAEGQAVTYRSYLCASFLLPLSPAHFAHHAHLQVCMQLNGAEWQAVRTAPITPLVPTCAHFLLPLTR